MSTKLTLFHHDKNILTNYFLDPLKENWIMSTLVVNSLKNVTNQPSLNPL